LDFSSFISTPGEWTFLKTLLLVHGQNELSLETILQGASQFEEGA
jgi:hypothetical protein